MEKNSRHLKMCSVLSLFPLPRPCFLRVEMLYPSLHVLHAMEVSGINKDTRKIKKVKKP